MQWLGPSLWASPDSALPRTPKSGQRPLTGAGRQEPIETGKQARPTGGWRQAGTVGRGPHLAMGDSSGNEQLVAPVRWCSTVPWMLARQKRGGLLQSSGPHCSVNFGFQGCSWGGVVGVVVDVRVSPTGLQPSPRHAYKVYSRMSANCLLLVWVGFLATSQVVFRSATPSGSLRQSRPSLLIIASPGTVDPIYAPSVASTDHLPAPRLKIRIQQPVICQPHRQTLWLVVPRRDAMGTLFSGTKLTLLSPAIHCLLGLGCQSDGQMNRLNVVLLLSALCL